MPNNKKTGWRSLLDYLYLRVATVTSFLSACHKTDAVWSPTAALQHLLLDIPERVTVVEREFLIRLDILGGKESDAREPEIFIINKHLAWHTVGFTGTFGFTNTVGFTLCLIITP